MAEHTIRVSGTPGTRFSLRYRTKSGCLSFLFGTRVSTWQKVEGVAPAEYKVTGNEVELRDITKGSGGELTIELVGTGGSYARFTM